MKRKHRRLAIVLSCGIGLSVAAALGLAAMRSDIVFFVTPSDLPAHAGSDRMLRLGGLVELGSVHRDMKADPPTVTFRITDRKQSVSVFYRGVLPDLFREGQGIVTLGHLQRDGTFEASEVLAKHDEVYMPKDVADALKKRGEWRPEGSSGANP